MERSKRLNHETPLAVGFGILSASQAIKLARMGADGIIVGSKIISTIKRGANAVEDVKNLVKSFVKALQGASQLSGQ